ncbi:hypothetical protein [Apilactobacillus ozensis]|nr:hypothetical protein [Apilactobacillus ozensis]
MLGTVDNHFKQIKHLMENIPNLYKSLNKTFPSQLSEIKAGHKKND